MWRIQGMTFNSWAKQLILGEIKSKGQATYTKQGWFCATTTGFLLHVGFEKISFGFFRISCNIMPLVAPLNEDYKGIYMNMGAAMDAGFEYYNRIGLPLFERPEFKSKEFESSEVSESCIAVIRHYVNPLFEKLDSLQSYCIQSIRDTCDYVYGSHSSQERNLIANDLFRKGYSDGIEKPSIWNDIVEPDYVWYAERINGLPFVYAALGKYKEALTVMKHQFKSYKMDPTSASLNEAMFKNDAEECNAILDRIYEKTVWRLKIHLD